MKISQQRILDILTKLDPAEAIVVARLGVFIGEGSWSFVTDDVRSDGRGTFTLRSAVNADSFLIVTADRISGVLVTLDRAGCESVGINPDISTVLEHYGVK